jgi:hypothetical protein
MADSIIPHSLDDFLASQPIGSIDRAIGNNLYGINQAKTPAAVQSNKDEYGFTFFTRPQLNLQLDNLRQDRKFFPLMTTNDNSIPAFIRCTLDPRVQRGYYYLTGGRQQRYSPPQHPRCLLVDPNQAFIPVLTNNLTKMSGWPDLSSNSFNSKPGLYKETYTQFDDISEYYEPYDLDATFRNTQGDPILYLIYIWYLYQSMVFAGTLLPYMDFIKENSIDYNTRIYRLVMDSNRKYVTKITACGVAHVGSIPIGSMFDFNIDQPYNDQNKEFSIRFHCIGAQYFDDILVKEFNRTTEIFNVSMRDKYRDESMVKVPRELLGYFKNRGYPRIDPSTYELEWYVHILHWQRATESILNQAGIKPESWSDNQEPALF